MLLTLCCADADGSGHIRVGKLNLVDLAGSERQSKTGATGEQHMLGRPTMHAARAARPMLAAGIPARYKLTGIPAVRLMVTHH
jgi:hypothetical protein